MDRRPLSLLAAAFLLMLIGGSGLAAGLTIMLAMTNASTIPLPGIEIGAGLALYGGLTAIAGLGLIWRRRWSWWLGVATIVAGELVLVWLIVLAGGDDVFTFGIVLWGLTLACLLAPASWRRRPAQ